MALDTFNDVLKLIRKSINCNNKEKLSISNWDDLFNEMKVQAVQAIPTDIVAEMIPNKEQNRLAQIVSSHIHTMNRHLLAQDSLVHLYEKNHLSFVILKGLAVSRYYPHPEYRSLGDIDIAVLHEDYDRACQIMQQDGYHEIETQYEKHAVFQKKGVIFEVHKYFASANDVAKATFIERIIQDGIKSPVICEIYGHRFPALPPNADGIMLLEHMSQHIERGIGLRHMIDWLVYVQHELSADIWENSFREIADQAGLSRLAQVSTKLCEMYLGMNDVHWCNDVDEKICDRLLSHVEQRGNFGGKAASSSHKAQELLSIYKGPLGWFRYLKRTGLYIPIVQRHKMLKPFAGIMRGCVLAYQYMQGGNTFFKLRQERKKAKEIEHFMDDLGVRRISKGHTYLKGESFIIRK